MRNIYKCYYIFEGRIDSKWGYVRYQIFHNHCYDKLATHSPMSNIPATFIHEAIKAKSLILITNPDNLEKLLRSGFLKTSSDAKNYIINTESGLFVDAMIEVIQADMNEVFPLKVAEGLALTYKYEEWLKSHYSDNQFRSFDFIIKPFCVGLLAKLHNEKKDDVITFYKNWLNEDPLTLYRFDEYFFDSLLHLQIGIEEICSVLLAESHHSKEHTQHEKTQLVLKLVSTNYDRALELYHYGKSNKLDTHAPLFALLLAGLYDNGLPDAIIDAKSYFGSNQCITLIFLGAITDKSPDLVDYTINLSTSIDLANPDVISSYVFTLHKILIAKIEQHQIDAIFDVFFMLLSQKVDSISNNVLGILSQLIKGYERERYDLLVKGIMQQLIHIKALKHYFTTFENPTYFFELLEYSCVYLRHRVNIKIFEGGFVHFINKDYQGTEQYILRFLTHDNMNVRIGILKLWISIRRREYLLNLTRLETEIEQLRAAEAMIAFPFGLEEILPSLLPLRLSPFASVVVYLQRSLSLLVFEGYHEYAMEMIEKYISDSVEDKIFIAPMKDALLTYNNMRKRKNEVKDLDPRANEKSALQQYYKLEGEYHAKSMNEVSKDENTFLSQIKEVAIVRGNAWKIEGRDISPLGRYESPFAIDMRMYKNPDQFEMNMNFPQAQF